MKRIAYIITLASFVGCVLIQCDSEDGFPAAAFPRLATRPVTEIGPNGAVFHAKTVQAGTDEVINRGFVWGTQEDINTLTSDKIEIGAGPADFDTNVSAALTAGTTYYVKAFAATKNVISYGTSVQFVAAGSMAPEVKGFTPASAKYMETVKVRGKRFSYVETNNTVKFGDLDAIVIESTDSTILCMVPRLTATPKVRISVNVANGVGQSVDYFELKP